MSFIQCQYCYTCTKLYVENVMFHSDFSYSERRVEIPFFWWFVFWDSVSFHIVLTLALRCFLSRYVNFIHFNQGRTDYKRTYHAMIGKISKSSVMKNLNTKLKKFTGHRLVDHCGKSGPQTAELCTIDKEPTERRYARELNSKCSKKCCRS